MAAQLVDVSSIAMASVRRVFASADHFDARTDSREVTVLMSNYATTVLGPALATLLRDEAPAAHLRVQQLASHLVDNAAETLRSADAMVLPPGILGYLPHRRLFSNEWVCLVGDQLGTLPMVMTYQSPAHRRPRPRRT